MTYRCAVKDVDNNVPFGKTMPVNYNDLTGIIVTETESLQEYNAFGIEGNGEFAGIKGNGGIFRDMIEPQSAEVLFSYTDEFYKGIASITRKEYGKGKVYYIGCGLDENITSRIMRTIMDENNIKTIESADGVEIVERGAGNKKIRFIINHNSKNTEAVDGEPQLKPFECRIIRV